MNELIPCSVILPNGDRVPARCQWLEDKQEFLVKVLTKDAGLDTPGTPEMILTLKREFVEIINP